MTDWNPKLRFLHKFSHINSWVLAPKITWVIFSFLAPWRPPFQKYIENFAQPFLTFDEVSLTIRANNKCHGRLECHWRLGREICAVLALSLSYVYHEYINLVLADIIGILAFSLSLALYSFITLKQIVPKSIAHICRRTKYIMIYWRNEWVQQTTNNNKISSLCWIKIGWKRCGRYKAKAEDRQRRKTHFCVHSKQIVGFFRIHVVFTISMKNHGRLLKRVETKNE